MDTLRQDLRYAARALRRNPVFTVAAILTLGLGIGANSAVFSVVDAVLLRPLPYPDGDRLVVVWGARGNTGRTLIGIPDLVAWSERNHTFADLSLVRNQSVNLTGGDAPDRLIGSFVSANMFTVLGARAERGRLMSDAESAHGSGQAVAVISHAAWVTRFGGDSNVIGRVLILNGRPHVVIGVTAESFRDPMGEIEVWLPITSAPGTDPFVRLDSANIATAQPMRVWSIARLKPGVTLAQAQADLSRIANQLAQEYPLTNAGTDATVLSLRQTLVGDLRPVLLMVLAFVAVVLLIACANVANLQLARATARERELALRAALGAGRRRLGRQMLTESLLLAGLGGVVGVTLAVWATRMLVAAVPGGLPTVADVTLDPRVLAFSALITLGAGLLFGVVPAMAASRADLRGAMERRSPATGSRRWPVVSLPARDVLVAAQLTLCIVLLVDAGLLARSLAALRNVVAGFDAHNVLTAEFRLPGAKYDAPEKIGLFMVRALEAVRAVPGVRDAAFVQAVPLSGNFGDVTYDVEGRPPEKIRPYALANVVSDGYFRTMGIPVRAGRDFDARDRADAPGAVIVSDAFARQAWPQADPLGRRVKIFGDADRWVTVVGVVGDVKQRAFDDAPAGGMLYQPMAQSIDIFNSVVARTASDPDALGKALRGAIWSVDRDQPVWKVRSEEFLVARDFAPRRFALTLAGLFALLSVVLAAIGVYGVMSYTLARRTREVGIRMALGARNAQVVRLVLGGGARIVLLAIVTGLPIAFSSEGLLRSQLYGVAASDPLTFVAAPLLLAAVALLATYLPARRAAGVDPMVALRTD